MALTRKFKDTVQARAKRDVAFRKALLRQSVECMLAGDVDTGKIILRDYINATIGFVTLGNKVKTSPKSLMRMFGPAGNPQAKKLFTVIAYLQKHGGVPLKVE